MAKIWIWTKAPKTCSSIIHDGTTPLQWQHLPSPCWVQVSRLSGELSIQATKQAAKHIQGVSHNIQGVPSRRQNKLLSTYRV